MEIHTEDETRTFHTRVDPSGRIHLPVELRQRNNIQAGDEMIVVEQAAGFVVKTLAQSVQEAQAYFQSVIPADISLVDELIADRKDEALRE